MPSPSRCVEELARLADSRALLCEINLGATAIGTGITAQPELPPARRRAPRRDHRPAGRRRSRPRRGDQRHRRVRPGLRRAQADRRQGVEDLQRPAAALLRPAGGLGELRLPARQAGSSIMPGKVNPVIPEMVNQVAFRVIGNDLTVTMAAEAGQLQLNAFEPVMAHGLLQGFTWTAAAFGSLRELCVDGIEVDREHLPASRRKRGLVTALTPQLGYAAAADIAKAALTGGAWSASWCWRPVWSVPSSSTACSTRSDWPASWSPPSGRKAGFLGLDVIEPTSRARDLRVVVGQRLDAAQSGRRGPYGR